MQKPDDETKLDASEKHRRELVRAELAQGRATLVETDISTGSAEDKAVVDHVLKAAAIIEHIYAKTRGVYGMDAQIAADDTASKALFHRNQGPFCEAPKTEKDPACNALTKAPARISGFYPVEIQHDPKFCAVLEKRKDADALMAPFVVVTVDVKHGEATSSPTAGGAPLIAVPDTVAFKDDMQAISAELKAAADAVVDAREAPFKAYLTAASQSFLDNNWQPADEAWAKMSVDNSKWYLRIGPDETYSEPCSRKGNFHTSFARINQDSLAWQKKLDPVKNDMEKALAELAGPPYKSRAVSFHLPDFIDIVLNAGDSRNATGATIGQSLPNWGPVANEGRGRTVAMTNLYTDKDSEAAWMGQVQSLFCKASMATVNFDPKHEVMSTVLHEAAHNLGPAHEYKANGKTDDQIFGGPLASTLEELKAQTSALYFADWLVEKKLIEKQAADFAHTRDVTWAFGHIAQGMYGADGKPKNYSQLASIQMGTLLANGGLAWNADEVAANGTDKGCFVVQLDKFPGAVKTLAKIVLHIKGAGDKAEAGKLMATFVDEKDGQWHTLKDVIAERWLRAPKASFVYAVKH
jgi:hypothetical protein